jgi:WD40 repeat protein/mono/diheme cytochrome c family protein
MVRFSSSVLVLCLGTATLGAAAPPPPGSGLAVRAMAILRERCASCHGDYVQPKGGFGYVLDRDRLLARGQIIAGRPAESPLYDRTARGEMPPGKNKVAEEELHILAAWITAGAPGSIQPSFPHVDVARAVAADLARMEQSDRRFTRYLSIAHLADAGASPGELELARQAIAKLVNSLSWHPRLRAPQSVDPGRTVFRIDLRWYRWTARNWDRLVARYPYTIENDSLRAAARLAGTELPLIRGDWFVATASSASFYHDFLNLPGTDRALERQLQVDVRANIDEHSVSRAGFNGSGVARNNRVLERHDTPLGAYWRSYDFRENTGRQNLFERPLGPLPGPHAFVAAGGEIIFHLPNGMLGFLLVDADGNRVDKAPGDIVSDPKRPDRLVENGISCLGCHASGIIPKDDQVRQHVLTHAKAFSPTVTDAVRGIYPPSASLRALVQEDNERYIRSLKKLSVGPGEPEPISTLVLRFEGVLDTRTAAAEADIPPEELARRIRKDGEFTRSLGPLLTGGTVQRPVFEEAYLRLVRSGNAVHTPGRPVPLNGIRGRVVALTWDTSLFGLIATAGDDRRVRVHWADTGKQHAVLDAETDEVEALAFTAEGKRVAWAGRDRVIRIGDLHDTESVTRFTGHTDTVKVVTFTPDGRLMLSAGADRVVRIWDLERNVEKAGLVGHTGVINALAVSPDGTRLLSGGNDRVVRLWDLTTGRLRSVWRDPAGAVLVVKFSPDGKSALAGSSDGGILVWNVETGKRLRSLTGRTDAVLTAAFTGKGILSVCRRTEGGVALRWSEEREWVGKDLGRAERIALSPDGRRLVIAEGAETRVVNVPRAGEK